MAACLADGTAAGAQAAKESGFIPTADLNPAVHAVTGTDTATTTWNLPESSGRKRKRFVDLQSDVTDADVALAVREAIGVRAPADKFALSLERTIAGLAAGDFFVNVDCRTVTDP